MTLFIYILIGLSFLGLLFSNIYFRVRMMKHYRALADKKVVFQATDIFSKKKMSRVKQRHPKQAILIETFSHTFRRSIFVVIGLILIILICWGILNVI